MSGESSRCARCNGLVTASKGRDLEHVLEVHAASCPTTHRHSLTDAGRARLDEGDQ